MPYPTPPTGEESDVVGPKDILGPGQTVVIWETEQTPIGPVLQPYAPANMTYYQLSATTTISGSGPQFIAVDAASGAATITLMPSSWSYMKMVHIVKTDNSANAVTIDKDASDSWYCSTSPLTLSAQWDSVTLVGISTDTLAGWYIIATM